jgi:hypothetical protein
MDPAPFIFSLLIFYTTFHQIEVFAKTVTPFSKVFVFAKGQKSVFAPTVMREGYGASSLKLT